MSSPQRRSAVRNVRDSGVSDTSNKRSIRANSFEQPVNTGRRNTHAGKRTSRRYARDVSYYYDDGEQRLRDLLETLEGHEGRLHKRQPIDRIDEPSEWRDRLRIMTPRLLTERHSLDHFSLPVIFNGGTQSQLSRFEKGLSDGITRIRHRLFLDVYRLGKRDRKMTRTVWRMVRRSRSSKQETATGSHWSAKRLERQVHSETERVSFSWEKNEIQRIGEDDGDCTAFVVRWYCIVTPVLSGRARALSMHFWDRRRE